jgi:DNA topoisomerase-2
MKKIEDKYKVLSHIDHILLRPSTYVGSNKPHTSEKWVLDTDKMVKKEVTFIGSFLKIFDEVITNSVDEHKRNQSLNNIEVRVNKQKGIISIRDNGGIPVVIHKDHGKYLPEVIFGNLMSSSNYDDTEERTTAGLNGVGAKCTNIFSTNFTISTCDGKKSFLQVFTNNMKDRTEPVIKNSKINHTEITYIPDYPRFGMTGLDDDHFELIKKRVWDIAGCNPTISVSFNGEPIKVSSFEDYIKYFKPEFFSESDKEKTWCVGVAHSEEGFQQISFVNTTETYDGGTHVDMIMNQIIIKLREFFQKKHKVDIKPSELKNHIFLFLNTTIINPSFSSQTKEKLITETKDFGITYEVSEKLIKSILKSPIVDSVLDWVKRKKEADENKLARELNKNISKLKVEKLIDAKSKNRSACSLGIFEGDCLEENTEIRVVRDEDIIDVKIKDVNVDDIVITHNNSFSNVYAISRKIKKKTTIKTKIGDVVCSEDHRWFVYDKVDNLFHFEETKNLDKKRHQLVKNYLAFTRSLLTILELSNEHLFLSNGETIYTNETHKFAVYNKDENKFEMVETKNINKDIHILVDTEMK